MEELRQPGGSQQRQRSASMFADLHSSSSSSSSYTTPIQTQIQQSYDTTFPLSASNVLFEPTTLGLEIGPSSSSTSTQFDSFVQPISDYSQQHPILFSAEHQHHQYQHQQQPQPQSQHFQSHITAKPYNSIATPFPLNLVNRTKLQGSNNVSKKQKDIQNHSSESVRCYWAIVSTRLSDSPTHLPYLHLDPSLKANVESLIGTSMLNCIHPNEANRIEFIILQYINQEKKSGKMIRCTMKSISMLNEYVHSTQSASSNHFDQLTDIRIEFIGDEMILCFFHTVEDLSKQDYNQMKKKQWSNFCESSLNTFDERHYQSLWQHIYSKRIQEPLANTTKRHRTGFPSIIFQILSNSSPNPNILFSWPPPRLFDSMMDHYNSSGMQIYNDGSYFADIFARSIVDNNLQEEDSNLSQLMTACTKRQIKSNTIKSDGLTIDFEVMIILIGEIKFAIFSISRAEYVSEEEVQPIGLRQYNPTSSIANPVEEHFNQPGQAYFLQAQQPNQTTFPMTIPSFQSMTNAESSFAAPVPRILYSTPSTRMMNNADLNEYGRRANSHVNSLLSKNTFSQLQSTQTQNEQKRQDVNMSLHASSQDGSSSSSSSSSFPFYSRPRSFTISESPSSTRTCLMCGTSKSPEWRKGPDGNKSLCNACGLRFSRNASRMKKKEEKARNAAEVAANGGVIPAHLRKKFKDERDRKRISLQKSSQSTTSSQQQQQQSSRSSSSQQSANQQGMNDLTNFVNLSPELQNQLPNSFFAPSLWESNSVNATSTNRIESVSPIQNFIPDSDMDLNEGFI